MNKITKPFIAIALMFFIVPVVNAQMEFIENKGQWDSRVNFRGDLNMGAFFLESNGFMIDLHNTSDLKKLSELQHGIGVAASGNNIINTAQSNAAANYAPIDHPGGGGGVDNNPPAITIRSHAYRVSFLGSNNNIERVPDKIQTAYNNYFIGSDRTKWASNCKIYQAIVYKNVYPNIDVRYYTEGGSLKYDLIVHPGGNPDAIAMRYDGADKLEIKNKELVIGTSVGEVKELSPYTYQIVSGKKEVIDCKYILKDNVIRFKISNYSATETLIIDPTLLFSSYTGSPQDNWGYTATPGPDGSFYAGGITFGPGYPVSPGAYQITFGGGANGEDTNNSHYDIALFKFSANGNKRLFATYLGGNGNEQPHSMICDRQGNLFVAGRSSSNNFPGVPNRAASRRDHDIIVAKLSSNGTSLLGAVQVGGTDDDGINIRAKYASDGTSPAADATRRNYGDDARGEIILDGAGNVFVASCTHSTDFIPAGTVTPIQQVFGGGRQDGVILKFNSNLSTELFRTYFGGKGDDACFVMAISPITGNLYVAGGTTSADLPGNKAGTVNSTYQGGECDGFVTQLFPDGSGIIKSTYIGTAANGADLVYGIQFDKFGFPYIMGTTTANDWPIKNATFSNTGGKQFICKLQPDFSAYVYSTVFGSGASSPNISPIAFLVDRCENVYVSGWGGGLNSSRLYNLTGTAGMPLKNELTYTNGQPITRSDGQDFYFFVMKKNADSILFGSYYGQFGGLGDHVDGGTSRFDANGIIYQAICACPTGATGPFPTTPGVWSPNSGSANCNEAAVKIEMNFAGVGASVEATLNGIVDTVGCVPLTIKFTDTLAKGKMYIWDYGDVPGGKKDTTYAPNNSISHTYNNVGDYKLTLVAIDSSTCNIADTAYTTIKVGNNQVVPNFTFTKLDSCSSLRFRFDNKTTAPNPTFTNQTFIWNFGDNSPTVRAGFTSQFHTFPSVGSYKVTLTVEDTVFCNSPESVSKTVRINPNVKAQFTTPTRGCVEYTPVFKNTSLGGTDWIWDFGDNSPVSTDFEPVHTYKQVGSYNVRLIAIDTSTCNRVDTSAYFIITVYPLPTAGFTWAPNPPLENTATNFTNTSIGATSYIWDFGDGETTNEVNPTHLYNSTGTFHVVLATFNDAGCSDTARHDVETIIKPLLDVPNAFTPGRFAGGHFNNGIIKVEGFGIDKMMWRIYNRWGQLVFATTNLKQGWDGTFKGVLQPMDVYAYTLDVEFTDGKKLRKTGDITLLR